MKTMLFNPYSGKPRHPLDIASDPEGKLMIDPDEPLRAAHMQPGAAADDARDAARYRKLRSNWFTMGAEYRDEVKFSTGGSRWTKQLDEDDLDAAVDKLPAAKPTEEQS